LNEPARSIFRRYVMASLEEFKELLSDDSRRIQLYDSFDQYCAQTIQQLGSDEMVHPVKWDPATLGDHLGQIHDKSSDLRSVMALLGFWSPSSHQRLATLHTGHFRQWIDSLPSKRYRNNLQWYPLLLQHYSLGLGAVSSGSFEILRSFLEAPYPDPSYQELRVPSILAVDAALSDTRQLFKLLPGREKNHTPLSEHLFSLFESDLSDVLFFGADYEYFFDRFEVLFSLQYSHLNERLYEGRFWAPVGRFGWKFLRRAGPDPLSDVHKEASQAKQSWPPLAAGFFDGDYDRFDEVVSNFSADLNRLGWH
jgi:hypothetical protein